MTVNHEGTEQVTVLDALKELAPQEQSMNDEPEAQEEDADDVAEEEDLTEAEDADDDQPDDDQEFDADDADEAPEDEQEATDEYQVTVNGEVQSVTLEGLKKGYMMEADYRQKTSALSEQRKQLEAEFADKTKEAVEQIELMQQALQAPVVDNATMARLADEDPDQYIRLDAQQKQRAEAMKQLEERKQAIKDQQQKFLESKVKEARQQFAEQFPDKATDAEFKKRESFLDGLGLGKDALNNVVNPTIYTLIDLAIKGSELRDKEAEAKKIAEKKSNKVAKTVKSKARTQNSRKEQRQAKLNSMSPEQRLVYLLEEQSQAGG